MDSSVEGGSRALALSNHIIVRCILDHSTIITIRKLRQINKTFKFYSDITIRERLREAIQHSRFTLYGPARYEDYKDDVEDEDGEDTSEADIACEHQTASEDEYGGLDSGGPGFFNEIHPGVEDFADPTMEWNGLAVATYNPILNDVDGEKFYSFSMSDKENTKCNRLTQFTVMEKLTLTIPQPHFVGDLPGPPVKFVLSDELHSVWENMEYGRDEYQLGRTVIVLWFRLVKGEPFNASDNEYATLFRRAAYVRISFRQEETAWYRVVRCDVDATRISPYSIRCSRILLTA